MPFLNPRLGWVNWWEYKLHATASWQRYEVVFYDDNQTEIALDHMGMGIDPHRYYLHGTVEKLSDQYGRIFITRVEKAMPSESDNPLEINIQDYEGSLLLEYFLVESSPHYQHPHDMLNMAATWYPQFEMLLILPTFTSEMVDALIWMYDNPSDDYDPPDVEAVKEVGEIVRYLDKCKLRKTEFPSDNSS